MRFDKFHPILAELIPTFEHQGVKCPACNNTMHHKVNYFGTLRWLKCAGCPNMVTIFQTAGQEYYDDLDMEIRITRGNTYDGWIRLNFDCTGQELSVFTYKTGDIEKLFFKCDLPKWESLKPDYVTKKNKVILDLLMNIHTICPFCKGELTVKQTKESKKHFCENKSCQLIGSVRFKMFTRDNKITHLNFFIEEFMVNISYLDNSMGIAAFAEEHINFTDVQTGISAPLHYLVRASESEVVINEAPEIKFEELVLLYKKIKLWMTFS